MPSHRAPAQPCERRENQSCDDARHSDVRPFRGARRNRLQRWDATPARYHCPAARSHRSLLWRSRCTREPCEYSAYPRIEYPDYREGEQREYPEYPAGCAARRHARLLRRVLRRNVRRDRWVPLTPPRVPRVPRVPRKVPIPPCSGPVSEVPHPEYPSVSVSRVLPAQRFPVISADHRRDVLRPSPPACAGRPSPVGHHSPSTIAVGMRRSAVAGRPSPVGMRRLRVQLDHVHWQGRVGDLRPGAPGASA